MSTARFDAVHGGALPARDLASIELWERSLARSRHRRRLAEIGRKARRRRKSVSLALSAALAAGPVVPSGLAAAEASSGTAAAGMDAGDGLAVSTASSRVVLELGSHGALVTALQRRLNDVLPFTHLAVDGIYGPVTRGAVVNFQRQHNLDATGAVDVRTWASMFNAPVIVMNAANDAGSGAGAGGSGAATRTSISSVPASGNSLGGAATAGGTAGTATARVTHAAEVLTSASAGASATPAAASTGNAGTDASATGGTGSQTAGTQTAGAWRGDTSTGTGSAGAGSDGTGTNASSGTGSSDASSLGGKSGSSSGGSSAGGSSAGGSGGPARSGSSGKATKPSVNSQSIAVVAPPKPSSTTQTLTYVLTNGVALPLPRQYITNGYVDQGVDYAAPGGTPEYAMGDGVIIGEGISGFGPNAPILQITSGPLKGLEVYYGHAGPNRRARRPARDRGAADHRGRLRHRRDLDRPAPRGRVLPTRRDGRGLEDARGHQQPAQPAPVRSRVGHIVGRRREGCHPRGERQSQAHRAGRSHRERAHVDERGRGLIWRRVGIAYDPGEHGVGLGFVVRRQRHERPGERARICGPLGELRRAGRRVRERSCTRELLSARLVAPVAPG